MYSLKVYPEKAPLEVIGDEAPSTEVPLEMAFAEGVYKAKMHKVSCDKDLRNARRSPKK